MKVLFVTRPHIGLGRGGLRRKISLIARGLEKRGVKVVYYDPWLDQIEDVDICHFFSTHSQMYHHAKAAKNRSKPIIISPVFGYCESPWLTMLKSHLAQYVPGFCYHFVLLKRMLLNADRILCLTEEGSVRMARIMGIDRELITVVPNGVDHRFAQTDPKLFERRYGVKDFVLQVGTIDPNKNQFTIIKAMVDLPYTYVIVGEPLLGHEAYMEKCRAAAGNNVLFIGQLDFDDPMLASAYAAAKVFCLPSYSETWGQTLYQAAQAGCSVIVSRNIPVSPYIGDYVNRANPKSPKQFRNLIEKAMGSEPNEKLRQAVLSMPTWQDVADQIIKIYEDVLVRR